MKAERGRTAEGKSGVDLLAFLTAPSEEQKPAPPRKAEETPISAEWEADMRQFLISKGGKATKTELYSWAKKRGIPPAALYSAISKMVSEGKILKRFDESSGELAYELSKG